MAVKNKPCFTCGKICTGYQCDSCRRKKSGLRVSTLRKKYKERMDKK